MYKILYDKVAIKQAKYLKSAKLEGKVRELLEAMKVDPFVTPPPFKALVGDKDGMYSRRINLQHRLVYSVDDISKEVYVHSMWSHYEF